MTNVTPVSKGDNMKRTKKLVGIVLTMAVLSGLAVSCEKYGSSEENEESTPAEIITAGSVLEELPRGEYEVSEVKGTGDMYDITEISALNDSRYLIVSDTSEYGDADVQKLYIADDKDGSITEITPDIGLGKTAYYSATGTTDGKIFITAVEPKYFLGKDPGHAEEENMPQDYIDHIFSHASRVNYKLFEIDTNGKVVSENKLDIDYDKERPVCWLKCEDSWDNELVISAKAVFDDCKRTTYYVADKSGSIKDEIENYIPYYRATVMKMTSKGNFCFVGTDFCSDTPRDALYFYYRYKKYYELEGEAGVKKEDFGCNSRSAGICAGTMGHGKDLLYLSSGIGLFAYDRDWQYENIINYIDLIPDNMEIQSVAVLDNNSVIVLGIGFFKDEECYKSVLYRFRSK